MSGYWHGELSNFAPLPVRWGGVVWPTSESVYQAMKTRDLALREAIRMARSPYEAKRIAYSRKDLWRADWMDVRIDAMRWTLRLKMRDNTSVLIPILERSQGMEIVEPTRKDLFWGGYWQDGQLVGENWLGKLWMEVREGL